MIFMWACRMECFSAHMLCEWAWPCAHSKVTTFTRFAQNCNAESLVYGSTMDVALSPGAALQCCTLGIGSEVRL